MTAIVDHRYCHPCDGEFWATVATCPDCGTTTVSYPPASRMDDETPPAERAPEEVMEFDLTSLTDTERRSLGPWLERAGIAHHWRDGVWLQVGAHHVDEAAAIIETLPPADDPVDPTGRRGELLGKVFGDRASAGTPALGSPSHIGSFSLVAMTVDWLRSKFRRWR